MSLHWKRMSRRFTGNVLLVASHNQGKVREFEALLADRVADVTSAAALGLPEPEETGDSFVANALIKARSAAETSGLPALADDSGLVVTALGFALTFATVQATPILASTFGWPIVLAALALGPAFGIVAMLRLRAMG